MITSCTSPSLFPPLVAQHSVLFDVQDPADLASQFPGLALPASLRRAARTRQIEYLAGRHCVRQALRGCAPEAADIVVGIGMQREPLWPEGVIGSITHSHGFASAAVAASSHVRALGIDVERVLSTEEAQRVAPGIVAVDELAQLQRGTGWALPLAVTVAFSAKEVIFKSLHAEVGRYFDFLDARIDRIKLQTGHFEACLAVALTQRLGSGFPLTGRFLVEDGMVSTAMLLEP